MAEDFLELDERARSGTLRAMEQRFGRPALILEKDIWVCWTLKALFTLPDAPRMAFKGGTSLSKVYGAIHRFSEDIDITIDYRSLNPEFHPFDAALSNRQRQLGCEDLKVRANEMVQKQFIPYLEYRLARGISGKASVEWLEAEESVLIHYPSALTDLSGGQYLKSSVLVEFGGRNTTEPMEEHLVTTYVEGKTVDLLFPQAKVTVLSGERTFWEKATLIHVECQRDDFAARVERKSRHWYDLAQLTDHDIGKRALANSALLADVVKHKKVFFSSGQANYDACLHGNLLLLPKSEDARESLEKDYAAMIEGGMFEEAPQPMNEILSKLEKLQAVVNEHAA